MGFILYPFVQRTFTQKAYVAHTTGQQGESLSCFHGQIHVRNACAGHTPRAAPCYTGSAAGGNHDGFVCCLVQRPLPPDFLKTFAKTRAILRFAQ